MIRERRGMGVKLRKKSFIKITAFLLLALCVICYVRRPAPEGKREALDTQEGRIRAGQEEEAVTEGFAAFTETEQALPEEEEEGRRVEECLSRMTLEEKVAQMFVITPEALTGQGNVTAAGDATREAIWAYPVGGLVYFGGNLGEERQIVEMIERQQAFSMERIGLPLFTAIDEEGGTVARIANESAVAVRHFPDMREIGASPDALAKAGEAGREIGKYLKRLGFNLDFAPVADVLTNPENSVVKKRSFGESAALAAELALEVSRQLEGQGVYSCLKHFPGHGATEGDSHNGFAYTKKTLEELLKEELIPFQEGIAAGISFIMAGHISAPNAVWDDTPASLSKAMITGVLRERMKFDGIVVTDALNMGAVSGSYSPKEAAELAAQAGADLLLMPEDFKEAYQGLLEAVKEGRVSQERIDASLRRILKKKLELLPAQ